MSELSQPERRALQQIQAKGDVHPDADLLTAFTEQVLSPRERQSVLAHLATCPTCREVVILSAPEPAPAPVVQTAKPWLWRWPVLRWGTVVASAVVIVAAVSIGYRESKHVAPQQSEEQVASPYPSKVTPTEQADQVLPSSSAPGAPAGVKRPKVRYEKVAPEQRNEKSARTKEQDGRAIGEVIQSAPVVAQTAPPPPAQQPSADRDLAVLSRQADQKAMMNAYEVKGAPVPSPARPAAPKSESAQGKNTASEAVEVAGNSGLASAPPQDLQLPDKLAKEKIQAGAKKADAPAKAGASVATFSAEPLKDASSRIPQWQVTRDGYLQRSFDRGRNWSQALPTSGFRAVAFIHDEVWAGGAGGVLLHSLDKGNSWTRISLSDNGSSLQGDITGIKFTDSQRGTVSTSAGETWITVDGGYSWSKQ
jgi:hypothetical protein